MEQEVYKDTDCLFFAAIDFGTTYIGYALAGRDALQKDNVTFMTSEWRSPFGQVTEYQTTSAVLFDSHGIAKAFGFQAEDKYGQLAMEVDELSEIKDEKERKEKDYRNWYFFRHFKMSLYNQLTVDKNYNLTDDTGKRMPAIKVFSALIEEMKKHLLLKISEKYKGLRQEDIMWTVTVPAIWTDSAKQFMREATEKAGISPKRLRIALEPECGAFFCRNSTTLRTEMKLLCPGKKYMVLDCGGGTIDIAVHEVMQGNKIKELYKSNGSDGGGKEVDRAFWQLLSSLLGREVIESFRQKEKFDEISLIQDFNIKKKTFSSNAEHFTLNIPISLLESFEEVTGKSINRKEMDKSLTFDKLTTGKVKWEYNKLRVDKSVAISLFDSSRKQIRKILKEQFMNPAVHGVDHIIMIGGLSESPIIQETVRECRPKAKVVVPADAALAVVKGAVMFGYDPFVVHSRISRFTYGKKVLLKFDSKQDPASYLTYDRDGNKFCDNRFYVFLKEGEEIVINKSEIITTSTPLYRDQEKMTIAIYVSKLGVPLYTTQCMKVGYIEFNIPKIENAMDRKFKTIMSFGDTESRVRVVDMASGQEVTSRFNFLG